MIDQNSLFFGEPSTGWTSRSNQANVNGYLQLELEGYVVTPLRTYFFVVCVRTGRLPRRNPLHERLRTHGFPCWVRPIFLRAGEPDLFFLELRFLPLTLHPFTDVRGGVHNFHPLVLADDEK